jgi:hypothetical protein
MPSKPMVKTVLEIVDAASRFNLDFCISNIVNGSRKIAVTSASKNGAPTVNNRYKNKIDVPIKISVLIGMPIPLFPGVLPG